MTFARATDDPERAADCSRVRPLTGDVDLRSSREYLRTVHDVMVLAGLVRVHDIGDGTPRPDLIVRPILFAFVLY